MMKKTSQKMLFARQKLLFVMKMKLLRQYLDKNAEKSSK